MRNSQKSSTKILTKKHAGKWVAISSDNKRVIGYSNSLEKLERRVGTKEVIYTKGLSPDSQYAF
jgi:hypothetical protein